MGVRKKHNPRPIYTLKGRTLLSRLWLIFTICCSIQFIRWHYQARNSLRAKFTATRVEDEDVLLGVHRAIRYDVDREARAVLLAARSDWRFLGSGHEGTTYRWSGSVVKTFKGLSPFRNCVSHTVALELLPETLNNATCVTRWPTEIPAALLFSQTPGFVPLEDIFFASESALDAPQWHLEMPMITGGTLDSLAARVRNESESQVQQPRELDARFRSDFEEFLAAVQKLHDRGFCHDDIKPDNVFVDSPANQGSWLLGDLGHVRELSHPYHSSKLWTDSMGALPDCRANDALRAVKTYMQFLRQASSSRSGTATSRDFDASLFDAVEPYARLFWRSVDAGNDLRVERLLDWSRNAEHPSAPAHYVSTLWRRPMGLLAGSLLRMFVGYEGVARRGASVALRIAASEGFSRFLGLTWLLGVPTGGC